MASFEELMNAARNADAAGDAAAAKRLLELAQQARSTSAPAAPASRLPAGARVVQERGDGVVYETADGTRGFTSPAYSTTDPERIEDIIAGEDPGIQLTAGERAAGAAGAVGRAVANFGEGIGRGAVNLAGTPANIMSAAPQIVNLLPGEQGVRPLPEILADPNTNVFVREGLRASLGPLAPLVTPVQAESDPSRLIPAFGSENLQSVIGQGADAVTAVTGVPIRDNPAFEDRTVTDRFSQRIGEEVGFTALPLAAALRGVMATGTNLASRAAGRLAGREIGVGVASGATAQGANEISELTGLFGATPNDNQIGTPTSDIVGSLVGSLGVPAGAGIARGAASAATGIGGGRRYLDEIAELAVRDETLANSLDAQRYLDEQGTLVGFDTSDMVNRLRTPAPVEGAVPGYRASAAERLQDPMLRTAEETLDARAPGLSNVRRIENNAAANRAVDALAPQGNPAEFRAAIQRSVDDRLTKSRAEVGTAQYLYDEALARLAVLESNASATARGSTMRAELASAYQAELKKVSDSIEALGTSGLSVDLRPLRQRFDNLAAQLPLNDQRRFLPAEVSTARALAPDPDEEMLAALGGGEPPPAPGGLNEATSIRSGLSSDILNADTPPQQRAVARQFRSEVDAYLDDLVNNPESGLDEATRDGLRAAQQQRFDVGQRFETPGTATAAALEETDRGMPRLDASAIPGRVVQPDQGRITDYRAVMREVGNNPNMRKAIEDTILVEARPHLSDPQKLARFMQERSIVLSDFPDLRKRLADAGASKATLDEVQRRSADLERTLTTPGRSPEANYLRFGDEDAARSVRTVLAADRPDEAARALLDATERTPQAVAGARRALWERITELGRGGTTLNGEAQWSPGRAAATMRDPKVEAVAREFWGDDFADFEALRGVFEALDATRPGQLRSTANPSGTAAAAAMQPGARLSPARVSADLRAVSQNRTSPLQVGIQWIADTLRNRSAEKQRAWIEQLMRATVDDPGRLANILENYNPALESLANRNVAGYRGVRGSQVATLLEELAAGEAPAENGDDELLNAIGAP